MSLAQAIPPIIAGFITSISLNLPTIFAAGSTLLAWLVFRIFFIKEQKLKNARIIDVAIDNIIK